MLLGLSVDAVVGGNGQHSGISLAGAGDHVLHEVAVTRCVDDCEVVVRSVELLVSDVDGDAALALFLQSVHHVGETESGLASLLCFLLESVDYVLLDMTTVEQ